MFSEQFSRWCPQGVGNVSGSGHRGLALFRDKAIDRLQKEPNFIKQVSAPRHNKHLSIKLDVLYKGDAYWCGYAIAKLRT